MFGAEYIENRGVALWAADVIAGKLRLLRIQSSTVFDNIRAVGLALSVVEGFRYRSTQPTYCYDHRMETLVPSTLAKRLKKYRKKATYQSYHVRLDRTYNLSSPLTPCFPPVGGTKGGVIKVPQYWGI